MRVIYKLKDDKAHLDKWPAISSGELPVHTSRGVITKRYMGSMNDWPEFTMRHDSGDETSWSRFGHSGEDDRYYRVGRRIEVDYVVQRRRPEAMDAGTERKIVLEVRIEVPPETIRERFIRHRTTDTE
jgi:hypothetical protein